MYDFEKYLQDVGHQTDDSAVFFGSDSNFDLIQSCGSTPVSDIVLKNLVIVSSVHLVQFLSCFLNFRLRAQLLR